MRAGILDRRVQVQRLTKGQDTATGQETETWTPIGFAWMGKRDAMGDEKWEGEQVFAELDTVFTARWNIAKDFRPKTHRLFYRGRIYDIEAIAEHGRQDAIKLGCVAQADSG